MSTDPIVTVRMPQLSGMPDALTWRARVVQDHGNGITRVRVVSGSVTFAPGELVDVSTDRIER